MLRSVTLLGSSSGRNAGDAALLSGLMESVDEQCGRSLPYEIPTIRPSYIRDNYPNSDARSVPMLPWNLSVKMLGLPTYRSIMRTDLTLIFDAILFDRFLYNPLFNFMSTLYLMLPRAKERGKRMGFYNVGAGPVNTQHGQKMLRELSELMDFITVRDEDSLEIIRGLGVKNPRVLLGADAALNVAALKPNEVAAIFGQLELDPQEETLAINVNKYLDTWAGSHVEPMGKERFLAVFSSALNRVGAELGVPILFVTTQHHDVGITRELMALLDPKRQTRLLANVEFNHYAVKGGLGNVSLLCGMRLHSLILASSEHTPVIGLAYQPKVAHYFNTLGLSEYCLGFEEFTEEKLTEHLLKGWENRAAIKAALDDRIPLLKNRAHKAAELAAAIDRGEDPDEAFARVAGAYSKSESGKENPRFG